MSMNGAMTIDERNALVKANEGLARYWGRKYAGRLGADDAMQEALLALVDASRRFDPARAPLDRFGAYAGPFIRGKLIRAVEALPRWTTETDLDAGGLESDDGHGMDRFAEPERPTGATVERAEEAMRFALSFLHPFERDLVADRRGLMGRPRLKWSAMERKHGRPSGWLRNVVSEAERRMAAALIVAADDGVWARARIVA